MRIVGIFLLGLFTIGATSIDSYELKHSFKTSIVDQVIYDDENSSLNPISSIIPFLFFHIKNLFNFR